jgi:mono/diheme cytochrome c family protein
MRQAIFGALILAGLSLSNSLTAQTSPPQEKVRRGEYLANIMDCAGCHTPGIFLGKPDMARRLAGSEVGFQIPGLGTFFPPNLTPDRETGLGSWSEADIIKAVRQGARPDGRVLAPAMPYMSYGKLTDADASALAAYLKSLKPIVNRVPAIIGPNEKATAPYLSVHMPQ